MPQDIWIVTLYDAANDPASFYFFASGDEATRFAGGFNALAAEFPHIPDRRAGVEFVPIVEDAAALLATLRDLATKETK